MEHYESITLRVSCFFFATLTEFFVISQGKIVDAEKMTLQSTQGSGRCKNDIINIKY